MGSRLTIHICFISHTHTHSLNLAFSWSFAACKKDVYININMCALCVKQNRPLVMYVALCLSVFLLVDLMHVTQFHPPHTTYTVYTCTQTDITSLLRTTYMINILQCRLTLKNYSNHSGIFEAKCKKNMYYRSERTIPRAKRFVPHDAAFNLIQKRSHKSIIAYDTKKWGINWNVEPFTEYKIIS